MANLRNRKNIVILLFTCFILCFLTACSRQPSKSTAMRYINLYLDEPFELINEEHYVDEYFTDDNEDIYTVHLIDSNIDVDFKCSCTYNDAWHKMWWIKAPRYFETKFISLSEKRSQLRKEKYPHIKEDFISTEKSGLGNSCNISIDSEEFYRELYDYLCEVYILNDFKYYNFNRGTKYWKDDIHLYCECNGKRIFSSNFAGLRKKINCPVSQQNDLISYEEFLARLENIDDL